MTDIPRPEHPRPDRRRADDWWCTLNSTWQFEIDRAASGEARGYATGRDLAGQIRVPFCPESALSGVGDTDFLNCVWYRRMVDVPDAWQGRRIFLRVGACDYATTVWLNGERLAEHVGGYAPFAAELTGRLRGDGHDELVVRAVDDLRHGGPPRGKQSPEFHSRGCLYTRTTGIWQTVWLEAVPRTCVRDVRVWPDLDSGTLTVQLLTDGPDAWEGRVMALADGEPVGEGAVGGRAGGGTWAQVALREPRAWSPADPFLYEVRVEIGGPGGADALTTWAGLRRFECDGTRFLLNGEPIFLRTVLDQGFYPDGIYTAPTAAALQADIDASMSLGFNGARLHEKVFEPQFLHMCDRSGYLVFGEFPDWGREFESAESVHAFADQWLEAMQRDLSHPAIIGWCPLNESAGAAHHSYGEWLTRHLYAITKALDPTRPALDTSGYAHFATDVWDCHNYGQDVEGFRAAFAPLAEGRPEEAYDSMRGRQLAYDGKCPYFVSEYGGIAWRVGQTPDSSWGYGAGPQTQEEFLARFRGLTEALLKNPGVAGLCYTQLTDVEQEINGLLTYERQMKFPPEQIAEVLTQKAAVEEA